MMDNYEKTIDLIHVFNYVKHNLKKIIKLTLFITIIVMLLIVGKNLNKPNEEECYVSTSQILFKFNNWSTTEEQYNFEEWNVVGEINSKNDSNGEFMANSSNIFMSNKILASIVDMYNYDGGISALKDNITVTRINDTDIMNVEVRAKTSEMAENVLDKLVEEGLNSVSDFYNLQYKVIDSYTEQESLAGKVDINGDIKFLVLSSIGTFVFAIFYYVMKCVFNDKVESLNLIEGVFGVPVLQVLGVDSNNYDIVTSKLINSESRTVMFTSVKKEEIIGKDVVEIARKLVERNKKTLVICVGRNDSVSELDGCENKIIDLISIEKEVYLKSILEENKGIYDVILIETNCLNDNYDALLISKYTDFTVMITKCNSIEIDNCRRIIQDFNKYSCGVSGVILKDVTEISSAYKYVDRNI